MSAKALDADQKTHYRRLAALKDDPAWDELVAELEAADERSWKRLTADLKGGAEIDQRTVDFMRGVQHAIKLITRQPDRAAAIYERDNERQEETNNED